MHIMKEEIEQVDAFGSALHSLILPRPLQLDPTPYSVAWSYPALHSLILPRTPQLDPTPHSAAWSYPALRSLILPRTPQLDPTPPSTADPTPHSTADLTPHSADWSYHTFLFLCEFNIIVCATCSTILCHYWFSCLLRNWCWMGRITWSTSTDHPEKTRWDQLDWNVTVADAL